MVNLSRLGSGIIWGCKNRWVIVSDIAKLARKGFQWPPDHYRIHPEQTPGNNLRMPYGQGNRRWQEVGGGSKLVHSDLPNQHPLKHKHSLLMGTRKTFSFHFMHENSLCDRSQAVASSQKDECRFTGDIVRRFRKLRRLIGTEESSVRTRKPSEDCEIRWLGQPKPESSPVFAGRKTMSEPALPKTNSANIFYTGKIFRYPLFTCGVCQISPVDNNWLTDNLNWYREIAVRNRLARRVTLHIGSVLGLCRVGRHVSPSAYDTCQRRTCILLLVIRERFPSIAQKTASRIQEIIPTRVYEVNERVTAVSYSCLLLRTMLVSTTFPGDWHSASRQNRVWWYPRLHFYYGDDTL